MTSSDEFHQHEVLHTASLVMQMFDDHVCSTRYVSSDPELAAAAQTTFDALFSFYQLVGQRSLHAGPDSACDTVQERAANPSG